MKDSQDWLELTIDETLRNRVKFIGNNEWSMIGYPDEVIQELKSAIRKHILQEIENEIEDFCEQVQDKANTVPPNLLLNEVVSIKWDKLSELRNKFNDKYKED